MTPDGKKTDVTPPRPTQWNGEPCTARQITAIVTDAPFPQYWARHLVGTRRNIVEVDYGDQTFYIDDEAGEGWHKVTNGGSPRFAHSNITIDPGSILPREPGTGPRQSTDTITDDQLTALYDERDHLKAWLQRGVDQHMAFGLLRPDGTDEQLPCADWCYACRIDRTEAERDDAAAQLDNTYRERARLLALLAALLPGSVTAPAEDLDEPGWQILYLYIGGHQASWHIHPRDTDLFEHVEHVNPGHPRAAWDGHSTEEKYERIRHHTAALSRNTIETGAETVQFARRFVLTHPDRPDIAGVEFPTGLVIVADPELGLLAATSISEAISEDPDRLTVRWAPEPDTAPATTQGATP